MIKKNAVIIGSGGHCRTIISLLKSVYESDIVAILDLSFVEGNELIMDIPVMSADSKLSGFAVKPNVEFFLAIGDNATRKYWWNKLQQLEVSCPNLIAPSAVIDDYSTIGIGNVICANAYVGPQVSLGNNNIINTGAVIEHEVEIGNHCHIAPSSTIAGRCSISDECFIGVGSVVVDKINVVKGITLGAGAVLVRDAVTENAIYIGIPARVK
jgi:sugar O-acyltransferase (sialic acid O-acetyltransferase NeuD family)